MATAFRIHEDIENHMEPSKKITSARNDQILTEKQEKPHHHHQQQRSTLAVLNNVQKNNVAGGRNSAAAHAQKTVNIKQIIIFFSIILLSVCIFLVLFLTFRWVLVFGFERLKGILYNFFL